MFDTIIHKLNEIEKQTQVKLLFVAESGSRAWGFPSSDSDYDVRGIFVHPREQYLAIDEPKQTFEWIENEWFDVGAWDIRKTLRLLKKSNCVLLEWLQSPIVYKQNPSSIQAQLLTLAEQYYQPYAVLYHYRGIAKTTLDKLQAESIRLKKWFYVLRSLLAAYWVVQKDTIPPMQLTQLLVTLPQATQQEILELVEFKKDKNEHFLWEPTPCLHQLIHQLWQDTEVKLSPRKTPDDEMLNQWFRALLHETHY